ncbi:MFS transporter [Laceyella putida]|uniref:MFS transporter n=1 Tax=Laceyella putida TaxID=110101 RepID=A0ABW2RQ72_9BACL
MIPTPRRIHVEKQRLPMQYVVFLMALFLSKLGDSLFTLTIPWISYQLTGSAVVMGSLFAIQVLPVVAFGPVAGIVIDRLDRKRLLMIADVAAMILVGLIPALHFAELLQLWHLYAISFLLSVFSLVFEVTTLSIIPQLAGSQLTKANAGYQFALQASLIVGPMLAGLLLALLNGYTVLWLDAGSFLFTLGAVWLLPLTRQPRASRGGWLEEWRSLWGDMMEGFRWLQQNRLNLSLSLQAMVGNFGTSAVLAVLMYYLLSVLHLTEEQSGMTYALFGIGGLLGSLVAIPLDRRFQRGTLIVGLLVLGTICAMLPYVSIYWLMPGISGGLVTLCNVAWNTIVASIRQETVPSQMLGRVLAFSRVLTRISMPLGAMVGTAIVSYEPVWIFALIAGTKAVEVMIALFSPIRKCD